MKHYKVLFHAKAKSEFDKMDNSVKILILKQIKKINKLPSLGDHLGNKYGINLTNYQKIYVDNKKIRIVYKAIEERIEILIIGIGYRDKSDIYNQIYTRLE
jgi:mRNA interferase RelE/StbE